MISPQVAFVSGTEELREYSETPLYAGFDVTLPATQRADGHLVVLVDGEPAARCSLWWREVAGLAGKRLGAIGHYAASHDASATALLASAGRRLADAGCTFAVGPMDGNTWRRYRFVTERGDEPPFFLEPDNPESYPAQLLAAGFEPVAHYTSALDTDLAHKDARAARVAERMDAAGIRIRRFRPEEFEEELARIHRVSTASFGGSFLYSPLPPTDFLALYRPLEASLRPELVLIAEDGPTPVGFIFALPDMAEAARGVPVDTVVIKTVAVLPGRRYAGLGILLAARVREAARELGLARAVNALMHDSNNSRNISSHYGSVMRGYTLFGKEL